MSDSNRAKIWLRAQPYSGNSEITIDCFPYGIAKDMSESLDLMEIHFCSEKPQITLGAEAP